MSKNTYHWSSVEFSGHWPKVWIRPKDAKPGEAGIALTFGTRAELQELVSILTGALLADQTRRGAR